MRRYKLAQAEYQAAPYVEHDRAASLRVEPVNPIHALAIAPDSLVREVTIVVPEGELLITDAAPVVFATPLSDPFTARASVPSSQTAVLVAAESCKETDALRCERVGMTRQRLTGSLPAGDTRVWHFAAPRRRDATQAVALRLTMQTEELSFDLAVGRYDVVDGVVVEVAELDDSIAFGDPTVDGGEYFELVDDEIRADGFYLALTNNEVTDPLPYVMRVEVGCLEYGIAL